VSPRRRLGSRHPGSARPGHSRLHVRGLGPVPLAIALAALLGGCNWPTFGEAHGADLQGQDISKLYSLMFITGLFVAALVWGLIFWCVVRYRRRKGNDGIPKQFQEHIPLEITYTVLPLIIVIVLFAFTVITENKVDAVDHPAAVTVNVTGYQWGWIFGYEHANGLTLRTQGAVQSLPAAKGYTASVYPQLVIPEGRTTKIILRSNDVVHEFYVHAFDFGRYAQPGVTNVFEFTPTETGVYPAQCSEYCGLYHAEMLFSVRVITYSQYESWLNYQEHHVNQIPKHYPLTQS
jgi:cytochrome c oxidase subunit 2